jgi:DivIVA domain-containing protein
MPISPDEITRKEFLPTTDGYDRQEVRAFLEIVAADQKRLLDKIESLTPDADDVAEVGSQVAAVLQRAGHLAETMTAEAEQKAAVTRRRVEEESEMLRSATSEAVERLRQEAEQYSYEVRVAAERAAREQQFNAADKVGRLLAGEAAVREKLYALETTLQAMRGDLSAAAESVLPEMKDIGRPLPPAPPPEDRPAVIDLREEPVALGTSHSREANGSPSNGVHQH